MPAHPLTFSSTNGPVSFWVIHIPTAAPEGLHVTAKLHHDDAFIEATITDATGSWRKSFWTIEEFTGWVDTLAKGPVVRVDNQKRAERFLGAAA